MPRSTSQEAADQKKRKGQHEKPRADARSSQPQK